MSPPTRSVRARYPVLVAGAAGRRLGAAAQQGLRRRQPAAAHPLPLLLRHGRAAATSASPAPAARRSAGSTDPRDPRRERRLHRRRIPSDMAVALAALDAEIELLGADGRPARVAIGDFHRLPGDTPHIETVLDAGRADHGRRPAAAAAGPAALPQGARPGVLRLRAGLGRGDRRDRAAARSRRRGSRSAAWRTSRGARRGGGRADRTAAPRWRRSGRRRGRAWPAPSGTATTTSRSSWRSARSAAHWRKRRRRAEEHAMTMIGQPLNRVDGPLKVSGRATYAYEHWDARPAALRLHRRRDDRQGPHHADRHARAPSGRPACAW